MLSLLKCLPLLLSDVELGSFSGRGFKRLLVLPCCFHEG